MKCDKCGYSDNGSGDWAHACGPVAIQRQPVANERIKQLWEQAVHGDGPHASVIADFAELIVRECIRTIQMGITRDGHNTEKYLRSMKHLKDIREHFGVEE